MPELPEVETTRKGIEPFLIGNDIVSVVIRQASLRWPISQEVYAIQNERVQSVLRRGKYLIVRLNTGSVLIHLGMSGNLRVVETGTPLKKHDHVDMNLSSGKIMRYHDPRRFGCILWAENWQTHALICSLGPEPLTDEFNADYLYQVSRTKKTSIKQVIMNGRIVVGVGNIYANESLYLAGIHPKRAANSLSRQQMASLVTEIKSVLKCAIQQGGTTLKDFVGSDGKPGYFQQQLYVYGCSGKPCQRCGTILQEIRQNNRSTVFCGHCQA